MTDEEIKLIFGNEYPEAVTSGGIRMPLQRETRFTRHYFNSEKRHGASVSKFFDGTVEMTFSQLQGEWPNWSEDERADFVSGHVNFSGVN
jgi:hypothetical protein